MLENDKKRSKKVQLEKIKDELKKEGQKIFTR
jgi:hypothetical protein